MCEISICQANQILVVLTLRMISHEVTLDAAQGGSLIHATIGTVKSISDYRLLFNTQTYASRIQEKVPAEGSNAHEVDAQCRGWLPDRKPRRRLGI